MAEYLQGIVVASRGIPVTLIISLVAVTGGMIIGLFVAIAKRSKYKILRAIATVYVDILRGTPLLVQVLILAYGVPQLLKSAFGIQFNWEHMIIVGFIACGINSSAYMGFIFIPVVPGVYRCCHSLSRDDSYAVQTGCVYRKEDGSE